MIKLSDIAAIAAARPDRPALICSDYSLPWRSVEASVSNLVASLSASLDLAAVGQAVFVSNNRIELILAMAAFATLGIPFCGIDYTLAPDGLRSALDSVGADLAVVSSRRLAPAALDVLRGRPGLALVDLDDALAGAVPLAALSLPCSAAPPAPAAPRAPRIVAFTSGTSGRPKPTLRRASTDLRRFGYFTRRYAFHADDRYLLSMPLYHVAGGGWARHFMGLGATLVLVPVDSPRAMAEAIRERGITATVTTPPNLGGILLALEASRPVRHALRFVLVGGKNFRPSDKARALSLLGPVIHEYYGSTETGVNTIAEPSDLAFYPASVGRPYDGNRVVILDDRDAVLPAGRRGRVAVSSYLMMDGYIGVRANEAVVDGERFLVTPDRGYLDEDARLYVLNRDSGAVGDFDNYAVEDGLRLVAGVRDAVVVTGGAPGAMWADCALVLDDPSAPAAALSRARAILIGHRLAPRNLRALDRIPYSLSGKVRWTELAEAMGAAPEAALLPELV